MWGIMVAIARYGVPIASVGRVRSCASLPKAAICVLACYSALSETYFGQSRGFIPEDALAAGLCTVK